ncbi:MAG: SRPBCC family protein, partial [Anaerolineae bacterium]
GVGATRHCDLTLFGASVEERITDWQAGREYAIEIFDGQKSPPFKTAVARLAVRDDGQGGTIVTGEFDYTLKYGPIGYLMDRFMVRPQFEKAFPRLLAGLKHNCETGEIVNAGTPIKMNAVMAAA